MPANIKKTPTIEFWDKTHTKQWLEKHTTFKFPETLTPVREFPEALEEFQKTPPGSWVWKPNTGRHSAGVVLFDRFENGFRLFPENEILDSDTAKEHLKNAVRKKVRGRREVRAHRFWFIEQWIKPHTSLLPFTDDPRCPPVIRFSGAPEIHFVSLVGLKKEHTGITSAGWETRVHLWLDLKGRIRRAEEIDLTYVLDPRSRYLVKERTLPNPPVDVILDWVPQVVEKLNSEITPKICLYNGRAWSCDGTLDENGEFITMELNHSPGAQFIGVRWKN